MPGQFLNYPFDEELFLHMWREAPDPVFTTLIESGALIADDVIANLISNGSNVYSAPYYSPLSGALQNYDGQTDIVATETSAISQSGVVYGRAKAFSARDFIADFHRADPMGHIVANVAEYHNRERQKRLIGIAEGIFGITGDTEWTKHIVNIAADIGATTIGTVAQMAMGDNASQLSLAIMHSAVAQQLKNMDLLEFLKYTSPAGVTSNLNLAQINNLRVIVTDEVPVSGNDYTTYLFGTGAFRFAAAPVEVPVEVDRDPAKNGGMDLLYTRIRETIHPNGFDFNYNSGMGVSPLDTALFGSTNYARKFVAKALPLAKLVTTVTPTP